MQMINCDGNSDFPVIDSLDIGTGNLFSLLTYKLTTHLLSTLLKIRMLELLTQDSNIHGRNIRKLWFQHSQVKWNT